MNHLTSINYEGTPQELVTEIGNLRYDALAEFLEMLSQKIGKDANADRERGRNKLSQELQAAADHIGIAWKICRKFMPDGNH